MLVFASDSLEEWSNYLSKILYMQTVSRKPLPAPTKIILPIAVIASMPYRTRAAGVDFVSRTILLSTSRLSRGLSWLQVNLDKKSPALGRAKLSCRPYWAWALSFSFAASI